MYVLTVGVPDGLVVSLAFADGDVTCVGFPTASYKYEVLSPAASVWSLRRPSL